MKNLINIRHDVINLDDNFKVLKVNTIINNIINFSMLIFLNKSLKSNLNNDLLTNKNIISYLRKFTVSMDSLNLVKKNIISNNNNFIIDYNWLSHLLFKLKNLNKFSKKSIVKSFFPFKNKSLSAYSFINDWFFFSIMDSSIINSELILKLIDRLGSDRNYKFFNRFNRIVNIDLNKIILLLRSGNIKSINDLSGKYKDFIGFLLFNVKKRHWYFKYMLKSYFAVYNNLTLSYYNYTYLFQVIDVIWIEILMFVKNKKILLISSFLGRIIILKMIILIANWLIILINNLIRFI